MSHCRNTLAGILMENGKKEEAERELRKVLETHQRSAVTHLLLGWLLIRKNDRQASDHALHTIRFGKFPIPCLSLLATCVQRGWASGDLLKALLQSCGLPEEVRKTVESRSREPLPLAEWERHISRVARSDFFRELQRTRLLPVNRQTWHVAFNEPTPRELEGMLPPFTHTQHRQG
jgi:hypothetical protein